MKKHFYWLTPLLFFVVFLLGMSWMVYSSISYDTCEKKTMINIVPFLYLGGYILSVFILRAINLKLHRINKEVYVKKEWIWILPIFNTISIPFAIWDLIMESSWGRWFKSTSIYKDFIDFEENMD
jgi:hypothetical protein